MGKRKRGGSRFGQHVEVDGRIFVEHARRKVPDEVLATDTRQVSSNATDQRRLQNTKAEEVRQTRPLARAIEIELVARVLAMHVVKRVVGMALVLERPDAGPVEPRAETELPSQRRLDVPRERPCRNAVGRQRCMDVIICSAERQQASLFALRKHDARNDAKRSGRGGNRAVILEPDRHVKSERLAWPTAIEWGRMRTILVPSLAGATIRR